MGSMVDSADLKMRKSRINSCNQKTMRRVNSSSEEQGEEKLEEEMIIEILVRLPVKSLARFKCVSNKLQGGGRYDHINFVRSPAAAQQQQQQQQQQHPEKIQESLSSVGGHNKLYMITSSNGFILCSLQPTNKPCNYFIINPITNQHLSLPIPNIISDYVTTTFICKVSASGFDHPPHYKVIRAITKVGEISTSLTIEFLTSHDDDDEVHQWKQVRLTASSPFELNIFDYPGIISETTGVAYWPAFKQIIPRVSPLLEGCIACDHRKQELDLIILPDIAQAKETYHGTLFGQTNGLVVFAVYNNQCIHMWVLNQTGKQWYLGYRFSNLKIIPPHNSDTPCFLIKAFHPLDPHLLLLELKGKDHNKVWYNAATKTVDSVPMLVYPGSKFPHFFLAYVCPNWPPSFYLFK